MKTDNRWKRYSGLMFTLKKLVEKRWDGHKNIPLGFIDLEKEYDMVPREMAMAVLKWMGVLKAEVRMLEGTLLFSAVSSPWDCSKCFTMHPLADLSTSLGSTQPCYSYCAKRLFVHISPVCSQVIIYTAE